MKDKIEFLLSVIDISKYKIRDASFVGTANIEMKSSRYEYNDINIAKIAHELNNPLTVVLNYVNGCIKRIEDESCNLVDLLKPLKEASKQSMRASELISRLKNHQQYYDFDFKNLNLIEIINSVIDIIKLENPDFPINIIFLECPFPNIDLDRYLIEQLLINLLRNSVDTLRDANTLNPTLIVEANRTGKDLVTVIINDNGPGISPEIIDRIFDLYFTTKSYGLGLGLPISLSIVKAHGGNISVMSDNARTVVSFTLKIAHT